MGLRQSNLEQRGRPVDRYCVNGEAAGTKRAGTKTRAGREARSGNQEQVAAASGSRFARGNFSKQGREWNTAVNFDRRWQCLRFSWFLDGSFSVFFSCLPSKARVCSLRTPARPAWKDRFESDRPTEGRSTRALTIPSHWP